MEWIYHSSFSRSPLIDTGSSVHGILQASTLEWVAMPSSRGSFPPESLLSPALAGGLFPTSTTWEAPKTWHSQIKLIHLKKQKQFMEKLQCANHRRWVHLGPCPQVPGQRLPQSRGPGVGAVSGPPTCPSSGSPLVSSACASRCSLLTSGTCQNGSPGYETPSTPATWTPSRTLAGASGLTELKTMIPTPLRWVWAHTSGGEG